MSNDRFHSFSFRVWTFLLSLLSLVSGLLAPSGALAASSRQRSRSPTSCVARFENLC